jgi:hypothetical protein
MEESMDKLEQAKAITKQLTELSQMEELETLIKNNIIEFPLDNKLYRVRTPNGKERDEVSKQRMIKYYEMLNDANYVFEEQLREMYKKKGKSIEKMESEIVGFQKKIDDLLLRLYKMTNEVDIKKIKDEIEELQNQKIEIENIKSELLQYCIEKQLTDFINSYFTYLLLEVKEGENWKKVYDNYKDFLETDDDKLILRGAYYLSILIYHRAI